MSSQTQVPPTVSVIIPVYNAEDYLSRCLDSAISQSLENIEILCVDDCSSDNSVSILEQYATRDSRIRVVRRDGNGGEGRARNTGLDQAQGDFVFHLDADDEIPPRALEILHTFAHCYDSDLVKGGFVRIYPPGMSKDVEEILPAELTINTSIAQSRYLQRVPGTHCSYLYRRSMLDSHAIRYPEGVVAGLDLLALLQSLVHARRVTLVPEVVYQYHQTEVSVTRGALSEKELFDVLDMRERIYDLLFEHGLEDAADLKLQSWEYFLGEYLRRFAQGEGRDKLAPVFDRLNALQQKKQVVPFHINTAPHFRYLLARITAGDYVEAGDFLVSPELAHGYKDNKLCKEHMAYVLEKFPGDEGALLRSAHISRLQGAPLEGVAMLQPALERCPAHIGANFEMVELLIALDRREEAVKYVLLVLKRLQDTGVHPEQFELAISKLAKALFGESAVPGDQLLQGEGLISSLQKRNLKLSGSLDTVHKSLSWKLTWPFRALRGLLSSS